MAERVMMGECRECRWWQVGDVSFGIPADWGHCTGHGNGAYTPSAADIARGFVINDDDAQLDTAPNFGCNRFAPREP